MKFIITGDWHLREDIPRCRKDKDWLKTQMNILNWLYLTAKKEKANIIQTGDIIHRSTVHSYIITMLLSVASNNPKVITYLLAGNHDLKYHNVKNILKNSFGNIWALARNPKFYSICDFANIGKRGHWEDDLEGESSELVALHKLVYEKIVPDFVNNGITVLDLVEQLKLDNPEMKWLFLGDNHSSFDCICDDVIVINPGCLIRQASDKKNYQPVVYLIDTEEKTWETIEVPDNEDMVEDSYVKDIEERNNRIEAFVESVKTGGNMTLDFQSNLQKAMKKSKLSEGVKNIILEGLEELK